MKKLFFVSLLVMIHFQMTSQKVIFLHHSTGNGVYNGGSGLPQWFTNYNTSNSTAYLISEQDYPDDPYAWDNYPYDYWNLWVNPGQCNNDLAGKRCLNYFTGNYDVIIFKHCFPGAAIVADAGNPLVSSAIKSQENYKLQYRALRSLMDTYPQHKFIVWTLAPLHRNATNVASALRARQFVDWVKNEWLTEDSKAHPNIYIFDFFGHAAELSENPANGLVNCLKYEYEGDHNGTDSHPNSLANATIMPLFGQFIVSVLQDNLSAIGDEGLNKLDIRFYPNPARNYIKIMGQEKIEILEILDLSGKSVQKHLCPEMEIDVSSLSKGTYIVKMGKGQYFKSRILVIE